MIDHLDPTSVTVYLLDFHYNQAMDGFKLTGTSLALIASLLLCTGVTTSSSSSPCAAFANAYENYFSEYPELEGLSATLPADIVYECASSVPVQKEYSKQLIESLRPWLELESEIDYLKKPLPGYLWDPIDVIEELNRIYDSVENDEYVGQYDIEVELQTLFLYFHDFHTIFKGNITVSVAWQRTPGLVSVSLDGMVMPEVYVFSDLITTDLEDNLYYSPSSNISSLSAINGIPVQEFLQTQQLVGYFHDPDCMYNALFCNLWNSDCTFEYPLFYPGPETVLTFHNGTSIHSSNEAYVSCNSVGDISTGQDYWDICINSSTPDATTTVSEPFSSPTSTAEPPEAPATTQILSYPPPVHIDRSGILSGYYLDGLGYDEVAVLVIRSFDSEEVPDYMITFQDTLESFLEVAQTQGKTRLIIDVQGNTGGSIDLGTELVAQLFPNVPPTQKGNYRASAGLSAALKKFGEQVDALNAQNPDDVGQMLENELSLAAIPAWQYVMTPNGTEFISFDDFYGPNEIKDYGLFTKFLQFNYSNTMPSDWDGESIDITGYGGRQRSLDTPPPFNSTNIIILSDGNCGSTCSIVFELLKNLHSIPAIVVGGRPIDGPMQAVGSTKGSQVFLQQHLSALVATFNNDTEFTTNWSAVAGTVFEHWDDFALQNGLKALNAKNNYRVDDNSESSLQMVYGAADCKIWYTAEMLVDPTALWRRAADIAFDPNRSEFGANNGPYLSEYCVYGSTGHPTSVTGGLKRG